MLVDNFVCNVCKKPFRNAQALRNHEVTHSDNRPFKCDAKDCNYACKTKDSLSKFLQSLATLALK